MFQYYHLLFPSHGINRKHMEKKKKEHISIKKRAAADVKDGNTIKALAQSSVICDLVSTQKTPLHFFLWTIKKEDKLWFHSSLQNSKGTLSIIWSIQKMKLQMQERMHLPQHTRVEDLQLAQNWHGFPHCEGSHQ